MIAAIVKLVEFIRRDLGSSWFSSTTSKTYPFGSRKKKRSNGVSRIGSIRVAPCACRRSFKLRKLGQRERDGDVPAEFFLEWRRLELGILDQVQLDPRCNLEPGGGRGDIAGPSGRLPTERILEESLPIGARRGSPE